MSKLICQNTGSYNRKTKTIFGEFIKPTQMQRIELNVDVENCICIGDKKYSVGEGVRDIQSRVDSEVHKICTMYDILDHSKNLDRVDVMLALPANYFLNREYRDKYKGILGKVISGEINGEYKTVFINRVEVYMEGAAAYLLHKDKYKGPVGLIDVGGNTINAMIFIDGKIVKESIVTMDLGMLKIERELIDTLNTKHPGWNVQSYEVKGLLNDAGDRVVSMLLDKYALQIKGALLEKKWNIGRIPVIATGGGASDLEVPLKTVFGNVNIVSDGVFDNVRGMWSVGRTLFKEGGLNV